MKNIFKNPVLPTLTVFIIAGFFLTLCNKKIDIHEKTISTTQTTITEATGHIGDPNRTPDLYIPELEYDWQYLPGGLGLRTLGMYPVFQNQTGDTVLKYSCWIANGAAFDYSGKNDFVVCMPCDGITTDPQSGVYSFPGMLSITTYQNGLPIFQVEKQRFFVVPTDAKIGFDWTKEKQYGMDTMWIPAGTADEYLNRAKVTMGKQLIVVEINPDLLITETNYQNNVSTLPVNITSLGQSSGVLDLSVIDENKTHTPINLTGVHLGKNIKTVALDWDCPYHAPFYVKHWFTVKRNGSVIADKITDSNYTDVVSGAFKSAVYEVAINVPGLGQSNFVSITVNK